MKYNGTKSRSTLENARLGITTTVNGAIAIVELTTETLQATKRIISNNLKAMEASGIRDIAMEARAEIRESSMVILDEIEEIEELIKDKTLSARRKQAYTDMLNFDIECLETIKATATLK